MNGICPKCGVNWLELAESLSNGDIDREIAILIIKNCPVCQHHFDYLLPTWSALEIEAVKIGGER